MKNKEGNTKFVENIKKLFISGKNKLQISKELGIPYGRVIRNFDNSIKHSLNKELNKKIEYLYFTKRLKSRDVAKAVGFKSPSSVLRRLIKMGKPRRKTTLYGNERMWGKGLNKENSEKRRLAGIKISNARKGITWEMMYGKEKANELKRKQAEVGRKSNKGKTMSIEQRLKLSMAHKGKKLSKEHREKIAKKNKERCKSKEFRRFMSSITTLEKNPAWKGGKSFEPYDKTFNERFKRAIRKRDNQICMLCGIHREKLNRALIVHHINYNKLLSIPQNCVSLCDSCHGKTGFNREYWITFFQSLLCDRYNYSYSVNQEPILNVGRINK